MFLYEHFLNTIFCFCLSLSLFSSFVFCLTLCLSFICLSVVFVSFFFSVPFFSFSFFLLFIPFIIFLLLFFCFFSTSPILFRHLFFSLLLFSVLLYLHFLSLSFLSRFLFLFLYLLLLSFSISFCFTSSSFSFYPSHVSRSPSPFLCLHRLLLDLLFCSPPFSWTHFSWTHFMMFWTSLAYLDLSFLFCISLLVKKHLTSKISQREYFFCTSLPLYCPSFFIIFRMCHLFLFVFLSSLFFNVFSFFFTAYFYCRSLSLCVFSLFVVPFANRVFLRFSPYFPSFLLVLMFFTSLCFFDAMTWCSRGWLRKVKCQRKERTKPKHVCHRMRNVIRSLREDVQVFASGWRTRVNGRTITKRANGRSWYRWCAFSAARCGAGRSLSRIRRSGSSWCDWELRQSTKIQVEPCLMMAALIGWTQAESFVRDGEGTMHAYLPIPIWIGRFEESTDVSTVAGIDLGPLQWCRARRRWQHTVCESFVDSTHVVSVAASPCCSIEITCNQVNLMTNHDGSDELLGNVSLLGVGVVDM